MGNRAIIAFEVAASEGYSYASGRREPIPARVEPFGIYLHWNGGPESIWAFLDVMTERQQSRGGDIAYGAARLVEIIGRFLGGSCSLGLVGFTDAEARLLTERTADTAHAADRQISPGDNGVYVVGWDGKRFAIVARLVGASYEVTSAARWLTAEAIAAEEQEARHGDYWTGAEPIPDVVRARNAFSDQAGADARAA